MWEEFKKFAVRGSVLDLAIGVVIGAAFGKIVTSFVNDIISPVVGLFLGHIKFENLFISLAGHYDTLADAQIANAPTLGDSGAVVKKDNSVVYEQAPLLKHLSQVYFDEPEKVVSKKPRNLGSKKARSSLISTIATPSTEEVLDICSSGEDQLYEFKAAGTSAEKLSKEICAFANTKMGGIIFYGVEDDGSIAGSDLSRQKFDQMLQNSIKHNITPTPAIKIVEQNILGYKIILVVIPAWNKKHVHHFQDGVYIRRGTNVFKTKTDETRRLHSGEYVI